MKEFDLGEIHSIEFINSLCIITKAQHNTNLLGERVVSGVDEQVHQVLKT